MKIKEGFLLRKFADKYIVVSIEDENSFNGIITLNETAAFVWEQLKNDISYDKLLASLLENFEVDKSVAERDLHNFLRIADEAGLLYG